MSEQSTPKSADQIRHERAEDLAHLGVASYTVISELLKFQDYKPIRDACYLAFELGLDLRRVLEAMYNIGMWEPLGDFLQPGDLAVNYMKVKAVLDEAGL